MCSTEAVAAGPGIRDIGVTRVEAAARGPMEKVAFKEDFWAAIIKKASARTFHVDHTPHRRSGDVHDSASIIKCFLRQRLTQASKVHHILHILAGALKGQLAIGSREISKPNVEGSDFKRSMSVN